VTAQFQINVLGSPELVRGGRSPVRFRSKKHLAVLLYLYLEGRTRSIPRDRLVDLLWSDVLPAKGRHSLSQALLAIRSCLGSGAVTGTQQVQLVAELSSDLSALGRGSIATARVAEPLQGLEDCGGAEFAHWVDGARARLKAQTRDILRAALQAARARGNPAETYRLAAALYDVDPLCAEAIYALAERAMVDRDAVTAIRLLKDHVQRARVELGTTPNPEIARLLRRLERGERLAVPVQALALADRLTRPSPFVAREVELARLEAISNRVVDGGYQACVITGAPGLGKSALLRRFATSLQARAWPVFIVSCQEIGQGIPYAAVSELITALARDPAAGGTDPLWLAEATRVCPGLRAIYPGVPEPPDAPADSIRLRVAEAVRRMMEAVAEGGPVLLAFDDLQFLDPASQEVLFLVTRVLEGTRVPTLLLAGERVGEGKRGGLAWGTTIELQPLDRAHALSLIRDLSIDSKTPDPDIREAIVRLSQGNPYHVEMLIVDWRTHQADSLVAAESLGDGVALTWTPPPDLRAVFARQFDVLSTDAQHALQVLAVAGKALAPAEVSSLLGLEGGAGERVILEMLDRGVGRVEHGRLSFKNELHRAFVYHAMGLDRRKYHHAQFAQRVAASLERHELQAMLEHVHHAIGAGFERQAMETGLVAAETAIVRGAPREAERLLTWLLRAYPVPPESRLRLLLAYALGAEAQYQRALQALAEWQVEGASATDRALAALIRADASQRGRLGGDAAISTAAQDAVALAEQANVTTFLVRANFIRMEVALDAGDLTTRDHAESLAAKIAASEASAECIAVANLTLGQGALSRAQFVRAVERLTAAAPVLEAMSLPLDLLRVLAVLGISYKALGRFPDAIRTLRNSVAVAERCGHQGGIVHSRLILGNLYHDLGFFDLAGQWYRGVVPGLEPLGSPRATTESYASIARFALVLANLAEAELAAERCEEGARRSGLWRHTVTALMTRAEVSVCKGQADLAWPLVEHAARITGDRSHLLPDAGLYERLQRQYCWATRGYEAVKSLAGRVPTAFFDSVADSLEVRLFHEAVARLAGDQIDSGTPALEEVVTQGLFGPLGRVLASGVHHPAVPQRLRGESAAQLLARVFPHPERTATLPSVGL